MKIHLFDRQHDLSIAPSSVRKLLREVLRREDARCDEISVHFVDTGKICELHAIFFEDPSETDCISFPLDPANSPGYCVLGELFVCPKTALRYVEQHGGSPHEETSLYLVHALLHLLGYDDIGDAEPEMREAEKFHMKNLQTRNLLLYPRDDG